MTNTPLRYGMLTVGGALHVWGRDKWELLSVEFYYEPPKIKLINQKRKKEKKVGECHCPQSG